MTETADLPGLVSARGEGSDVFDDPALFFLTHEALIRRWAELAERARQASEEFLMTLQADLEEIALERDLVPALADTSGGYRHLLMSPAGTPPADDRHPAIAFCFGWQRKSFRVTKHTYSPFVGVRVGGGVSAIAARAAFLDGSDGEARRLRSTEGYLRANEWPVWKPVVGGENWWTDLDGYRHDAVEALTRIIEIFSAHMRRAGGELVGSAPA